MSAVFLKILNMSITASWLILAVVLVRLLLKKAPKWIPCLLWGLVAIRLICPFSFGSILSLIPSSETIPTNITVQQEPAINSGITAINDIINPVIAESFTPVPTDSVNPLQIIIPVAAIVWISGIVIMQAYALISYIKLKKTVSVYVPVGERILSCDEVKAPFILGVFRPVIYVPSSMAGETLDLVIRHETAHLQRRDHWWKPLGYILLTFYWFNPLCWIAYILLCRDIEMACDEKVIRDMDKDDMAAYSQALLDCSFPRKRIAACPLAFGEVGVKDRVKGVLNYRKPAFWIILIALVVCAVTVVCFLTDPVTGIKLDSVESVTVDNISVSDEAAAELISLINSYRRAPFVVGLDNPNSLSRAIHLNCANGDSYLLHYQYYSGYSLDPRHPGEDDYRSILTFFPSGGSGKKAWKMEYAFDAELSAWLVKFVSPNTRSDQYVSEKDEPPSHDTAQDTTPELAALRGKYPEYFDLSTFKGLELYVWQMAPDSYSCGLMLGTNRNKTLEELMNLKGASIAEMRAILSTYDIDEKEVFIIPWQNPISSYIAEYWVKLEDEDPSSVEKRQQEYIDGIRHMLFDDTQNGGYDLSNAIVDIKTTVAYANWTEGGMMRDCLNGEKMIISSVRHLPVYKLDTLEDLNRFKESFKDILTLDQGYDEVPSFNEVTASYDNSFFADRTLILAYVEASSGSFRYAIQNVSYGGSTFCLNVVQTNHPEVGTTDMAGWFVIAEVLDSDIANITEFDATLQ